MFLHLAKFLGRWKTQKVVDSAVRLIFESRNLLMHQTKYSNVKRNIWFVLQCYVAGYTYDGTKAFDIFSELAELPNAFPSFYLTPLLSQYSLTESLGIEMQFMMCLCI